MKGTFSQSKNLKEIIESHKWTLYDVSDTPEGRAHTWEEIDSMTPAGIYKVGHNYLFVPIPKPGETLRQAYTLTKGLGPSLTIDDPNDDMWLSIVVQKKSNGNVALFSRFFLHEKCAVFSSPETVYVRDPDFVAVRYDKLVDTFRRHFRIVLPEEYGLEAPIPMPIVPILN